MILAITSLDTGPDLSPAEERKHRYHKGQSPDETYYIGHPSSGDDSVVSEGVIYRCNGT